MHMGGGLRSRLVAVTVMMMVVSLRGRLVHDFAVGVTRGVGLSPKTTWVSSCAGARRVVVVTDVMRLLMKLVWVGAEG